MKKVERKINYKRVTLSLPKDLVREMKSKIDKNKMSAFVAEVVKEGLQKKDLRKDVSFLEELRELANKNSENFKTTKSSLELLREVRYGE